MTTEQPDISIVIPTHNRADMLPIAVESVLRQTYGKWELIIVEDACTDHTADVVARFRRRDPRIRSVQNTKYAHCCGGARAAGIDNVRGEFTAFLDDDDTWPDYHLEGLLRCLVANPDVDWVFGDKQPVDTDGEPLGESRFVSWPDRVKLISEVRGDVRVLISDRLIEGALRHQLPAQLPVSLIRSTVFEKARVRDIFGLEDVLFKYEAASRGVRFGFVERCHLFYLAHDGNVSATRLNGDFDAAEKVQLAGYEFLSEHMPRYVTLTKTERRILRRRTAEFCVWRLGNGVYRENGYRKDAIRWILRGIRSRPFQWRYWKTLFGAIISR